MGTAAHFSTIFQLFNVVFIIGLVYIVYYLAVKLPRNLSERNEILTRIERKLDEVNAKIDKS